MLPRECGAFSTRGAGRGTFEGEKREQIGSRGRLLHPRSLSSLRGVYKAAGAQKTTTATRAAAVQAGQLYFVNLVCSAAAYGGEVRF